MSLKDLIHEDWDNFENNNLYQSSLKVDLENKFIFVYILIALV